MTLPETVIVGDKVITVWEATLGQHLHRLTMLEKAQEDIKTMDLSRLEAKVRAGFHANTYPGLASCSTCPTGIPSEDECYDYSKKQMDNWVAATQHMNPDWYAIPADPSKEEETKKEQTPTP